MVDPSVVIIGLPESGKTTFLGALWHLVTAREIPTKLQLHNLLSGDLSHLNAIAARWREARVQDHTAVGGNKRVSMNLRSGANAGLHVTFPDIAGEAYSRMWEERACDQEVAGVLKAGAVLLFIHADRIRAPRWVVDEVAMSRQLGLVVAAGEEVPWHPRLAPTQVQLVALLQLLRQPPLDHGPRRLAVMLSAWDKVADEGLEPESFLESRLPLLWQYLCAGVDGWTWRAYGLSAQGGDYDAAEGDPSSSPDAQALRELNQPSTRIRLRYDNTDTHDLTEPLAWLTE